MFILYFGSKYTILISNIQKKANKNWQYQKKRLNLQQFSTRINMKHHKLLTKRSILIILLLCSVLYPAYLGIRIFIADYFTIPTCSMQPTLKPGDKIIVNKLLFGARIYTDFHFSKEGSELKAFRTNGIRGIQRNDIIVFNKTYHKNKEIKFIINQVYCKRCVALPGDTISIVDGKTINNRHSGTLGIHKEIEKLMHTPDSAINKKCLRAMPKEKHFHWTIRNFGPYYVPRKGDLIPIDARTATLYKSILEWEIGKQLIIDWNTNRVTAGQRHLTKYEFKNNYYFMMGDNVLDSDDSRYKGAIPESYIIGIVDKII